jgi:hypothetical protein
MRWVAASCSPTHPSHTHQPMSVVRPAQDQAIHLSRVVVLCAPWVCFHAFGLSDRAHDRIFSAVHVHIQGHGLSHLTSIGLLSISLVFCLASPRSPFFILRRGRYYACLDFENEQFLLVYHLPLRRLRVQVRPCQRPPGRTSRASWLEIRRLTFSSHSAVRNRLYAVPLSSTQDTMSSEEEQSPKFGHFAREVEIPHDPDAGRSEAEREAIVREADQHGLVCRSDRTSGPQIG